MDRIKTIENAGRKGYQNRVESFVSSFSRHSLIQDWNRDPFSFFELSPKTASHVMPPIQLHIAVLDCDTPVPNVYAERGLYSDIFAALLRKSVEKTPSLPPVDLQFSKYDCVAGHVPSEDDLLQIDGVIITGSGMFPFGSVTTKFIVC